MTPEEWAARATAKLTPVKLRLTEMAGPLRVGDVFESGPEFAGNLAAALAPLFREAVALERERCARVVEQTDMAEVWGVDADGGSVWHSDAERTLADAAARIRRGDEPE